jgi:hypothetical protein
VNVLLKVAAVALLGLVVVSCGGGDSGEEDAIRDVFQSFFEAFEDEDEAKLASLLSDDCTDADAIAESAIASYISRGLEDFSYDVTGARLRDLTETTVEALPQGTSRVDDSEFPLADDDAEYTRLEKIDGEWKLVDCNILF